MSQHQIQFELLKLLRSNATHWLNLTPKVAAQCSTALSQDELILHAIQLARSNDRVEMFQPGFVFLRYTPQAGDRVLVKDTIDPSLMGLPQRRYRGKMGTVPGPVTQGRLTYVVPDHPVKPRDAAGVPYFAEDLIFLEASQHRLVQSLRLQLLAALVQP